MKKQKKSKSRSADDKIDVADSVVLYDNIILKPITIDSDEMVLNPQQYEDKPEWGKVISCGEGRVFDNGTVIPLKVHVGDTVLFQKYSAQKFRHRGEDYIVIREEDIYLIA